MRNRPEGNETRKRDFPSYALFVRSSLAIVRSTQNRRSAGIGGELRCKASLPVGTGTVKLPVREEAKPRQINIEVAA